MDSEYRITLHVKATGGFETYAEFFLGNDRTDAISLFKTLRGSDDITDDSILLMELRAIRRGLPIDIQMKNCTLDEISENCRAITKYFFNSYNLKKSSDN